MVKVGVVSLGCDKNRVDSEIMLYNLKKGGFEITGDPSQADIIIVNTCAFIESARKESIDTVFEMAKYKNGKCKKLVMTGCMPQKFIDQLFDEFTEVDGFLGTNDYESIADFLKGKNQDLIKDLKEKIRRHSENLEFERAQEYKKMLDSINHITEKQNVEFKDKINRDFFSFHTRENYIAIALFSYREGILLSKRSFCYELIGEINEFVSEIIYQYYSINAIPNEVIVSNEEIKDNLMDYFENANVFAPTKGKLHDVLDICEINAKEALDEHFLTAKLDDDVLNLLDKLGNILHIKTPTRIELFDNSHLQGTNAIGAMVVFINGIPYKKLYRKFNIQGVNKKDDLSSMRETLTRRYKRVKEENGEMPDLIIVDGGKGQIETALEVKKALNLPFSIAGLVKTSKHRTSALMDENFNERYNILLDLIDNLANSDIEAYQSYATEPRAYDGPEMNLPLITENERSFYFYRYQMLAEAKITARMYFRLPSAYSEADTPVDMSNFTVEVTYIDFQGEQVTEVITSDSFQPEGRVNRVYVDVPFRAPDLRAVVSYVVKENGVEVGPVATISFENMLAEVVASSNNQSQIDALNSLMAFSDAAYDYLGK